MYRLKAATLISASVATGSTSARGSPRIDAMLEPGGAAEGKNRNSTENAAMRRKPMRKLGIEYRMKDSPVKA
jgi:hypothetical protein